MADMRWRARIDTPDGAVLGAGLLVGGKTVLTCAHVVDGRTEVRVSFPGTAEELPARVALRGPWRGSGDTGDIAVVELRNSVPFGGCTFAAPGALLPQPGQSSQELDAMGFPRGHEQDGIYATLRSSADWLLREEWLQVDVGDAHLQAINTGFSGSGVWLPHSGEVVGMITDAVLDRDGNGYVGRMLPTGTIRRHWQGLGDFLPLSWNLLFEAVIKKPSGQLALGFGPDNTLVVVEQSAAVHRWALASGTERPGMPPGDRLPSGIHAATCTTMPAVAVARPGRLTLVHFDRGGHQIAAEVPLERNEFLGRGGGECFSTYNGDRVAVRDFRDGSVLWRQRCPPQLATTAVDPTGTAVATADGRVFGSGNEVSVGTERNSSLYQFHVDNLFRLGAGCVLGISPGGEFVACASLREVALVRPHDGQVVYRHRLTDLRKDTAPALGTRPQRLICLPGGAVLWLRGRRVMLFSGSDGEPLDITGDELCHDIAFDYPGGRLAAVYESGRVRVWRWPG
jgi:hypothetical protein